MKTAVADSIIPREELMVRCRHSLITRTCTICWHDLQKRYGLIRGGSGPQIVKPEDLDEEDTLVPDEEPEEDEDPDEDDPKKLRSRDPAEIAFDKPPRRPRATRKPVEEELIPPELLDLELPENGKGDAEATKAAIADAARDATAGSRAQEKGNGKRNTPVPLTNKDDAARSTILHPILGTPLLPLSPEESALKSRLSKLPPGTVFEVPANRVKPLQGQPRIYFDGKKIERLGQSIRQRQQRKPIEVRLLPNDPFWFCELVDGERRLRATLLTRIEPGKPIPTIKGMAGVMQDEEEQFEESAIANAGREGYTPLELARIIERLNTRRKRTLQEIATDLNITKTWASRVRTLNRLHPDLQNMMGPGVPKAQRLGLTLALQLAKIQEHSIQLMLVGEIRDRKMKMARALPYVRQRMKELGLSDSTRKRRTPREDYSVFTASMSVARTRLGIMQDLSRTIPQMFEHRPPTDLDEALAAVREIAEIAGELRNKFELQRTIRDSPGQHETLIA